jgi:hypothetical protein
MHSGINFTSRQWTSFWILSPYLGPLVANGVLAVNPGNLGLWHWGFGQFAVLSGVSFVVLCLFADETWYATSILYRSSSSFELTAD